MAENEIIFDSSILQNIAVHKIEKAETAKLCDLELIKINQIS